MPQNSIHYTLFLNKFSLFTRKILKKQRKYYTCPKETTYTIT